MAFFSSQNHAHQQEGPSNRKGKGTSSLHFLKCGKIRPYILGSETTSWPQKCDPDSEELLGKGVGVKKISRGEWKETTCASKSVYKVFQSSRDNQPFPLWIRSQDGEQTVDYWRCLETSVFQNSGLGSFVMYRVVSEQRLPLASGCYNCCISSNSSSPSQWMANQVINIFSQKITLLFISPTHCPPILCYNYWICCIIWKVEFFLTWTKKGDGYVSQCMGLVQA